MGRKNGVNKKCFLDLSILSAMQQGLEKPQLLEMYTIYMYTTVGWFRRFIWGKFSTMI